MTMLSRALSFFSALVVVGTAASFVAAIVTRSPLWLLLGAGVLYGLPLVSFRVLGAIRPLREGRSWLDAPGYSPWWGGHELQRIFIALPQLESLLQLVPGLFSTWLRLWGSRIGRGVHWTGRVEIADRGLLEVGSRVVFGHKVECFSHVVRPGRRGLILYVRRIRIGDGAFIGAGSRLGPGVEIEAGASVPILSDLYVGQRFPAALPHAHGEAGVETTQ